MTTILTSNVKAAVLASVVAMFATQAHAQTNELPSATVRYSDLDLTTESGAHHLYRRIVFAAQRVCSSDHTRDLNTLTRARNCQAEAISQAVRAVSSPQLATIYAERVGRG